jgi:hypothetical protein
MNLQEQISRIQSMMGIINETNIFFRRRVTPPEIASYFDVFDNKTFDETDNYADYKYNLVLTSLEHVLWIKFKLGWEELPEKEEIAYINLVSEIYEDEIKKLYNKHPIRQL